MPHIDPANTIQQVFPYLIVRDCPAAIEFYKRIFGAEENMRLAEPGGRIGHAELKLGAAMVMIAEEHPDRGVLSPLAYGGTGSFLHLHVANVDDMTARAAEAGAKSLPNQRRSSMANAPLKSKTPSATSGCSANTSKKSHRMKCSAATLSYCREAHSMHVVHSPRGAKQ